MDIEPQRNSREFFESGLDTEKGGISTPKKSKSSLRMKYEAERSVLIDQFGGLEDIRMRLGLSKRKMSQLLLVDPSAWTRWVKDESQAPPHIYRALQWYQELIEKRPEWSPQNSFQPYTSQFQPKFDKQWDEIQVTVEQSLSRIKNQSSDMRHLLENSQSEWEREKASLQERIEKKDTSLTVWKLIVLIHSCVFFFTLLWMFL